MVVEDDDYIHMYPPRLYPWPIIIVFCVYLFLLLNFSWFYVSVFIWIPASNHVLMILMYVDLLSTIKHSGGGVML